LTGVNAIAGTALLVGEFPTENGRVIFVLNTAVGVGMVEQVSDPVLVPLPDRRVRVELVMILATLPAHVLIHAAELVVIVDERNDELYVELAGLVDHIIKMLWPVSTSLKAGAEPSQ